MDFGVKEDWWEFWLGLDFGSGANFKCGLLNSTLLYCV
jgi:hypothetical protein